MDNSNSPQQIPSANKTVKNLSIKEFFTTRLMRARSFEGGNGKDDTSNWFDEFKARMSKKSQPSSVKQTACSSNSSATDDNDETAESTGQSKISKLIRSDTLVEDSSDNCEKVIGSKDGRNSFLSSDGTAQNDVPKEAPMSTSGLRTKKFNKISNADSPDFDTSSINTIFNRRDSRYESLSRRSDRWIPRRITSSFSWTISKFLPFNYNLPWKLLAFINSTFVIIVLAVITETSPGLKTLSFFNGFIIGLIIAAACFMFLTMSLLTYMFPSPDESNYKILNNSIQFSRTRIDNLANTITDKNDKQTVPLEHRIKTQEIPTSSDIIDDSNQTLGEDALPTKADSPLIDDDHRGWMIEFIGDYEMRNKSEFKLKLIFVKIEDKVLYLCKPKNSHDAETNTFPVFISQRVYDLNTVQKFSASLLLPRTVRNRQKWVWSKKYPIRLEFQEDSDQANKSSDTNKYTHLTLFAKSCREKEEWFRRFKRITEDTKFASNMQSKRLSNVSESGESSEDFVSTSKYPDMSPKQSKKDLVQMSRSSHLLGEAKKLFNEESSNQDKASNLSRTKSCEQLNSDKVSLSESCDRDRIDEDDFESSSMNADDSTLTKESAEIFSQAIEFSNFLESQPTLDYREYIERVIESSQDATNTCDWFNALTGRIFFDVLSHNFWSLWFKKKIQRKLHRIRLPYFMETLTLTQIDLGSNAPQFLNVVSHSFDSFGLSIDFDMAYSGGLTMTFETKLNLLKIKTDNSTNISSSASQQQGIASNSGSSSGTNNLSVSTDDSNSTSMNSLENFHKETVQLSSSSSVSTQSSSETSDSDDSESSSSSGSSLDEAEVDEISDWEGYGAEKTRQSIVKFVDKIASSRYFQHATENRYIKKKLQDISNCPLILVVKIQSLNGVLTINVPPPKTNRLWYGFKPNPELTLKALPKMGDRELTLSHVTDWIERKLAEEFRKIFVIPNMEDIVLPVLKSDHLIYVTTTK